MISGTSFVYILASRSGVLYVGVTSDLFRRIWQHRSGALEGFTRRYKVNRLVYYEVADEVAGAIAREKQIKAWRRGKRVQLIEQANPGWRDLAADWFDDEETSTSHRGRVLQRHDGLGDAGRTESFRQAPATAVSSRRREADPSGLRAARSTSRDDVP